MEERRMVTSAHTTKLASNEITMNIFQIPFVYPGHGTGFSIDLLAEGELFVFNYSIRDHY